MIGQIACWAYVGLLTVLGVAFQYARRLEEREQRERRNRWPRHPL